MWRSKKFITIVSVLAAVLLAGGIGGIVFAQTTNGDYSQPKARCGALLDRACEIYQQKTGVAINQEVLKEAFAQAASEMCPKAPPDRPKMGPEDTQNRLQNLMEEGKITQEQIDALQEWWDSRPEVPLGFGFPKHGRFPGMGGPCAPPPPE